MTCQILQGDCLEVLKSLPDGSVHTCITSPPYYGLRDYGTAKWEGGDSECDHKIPEVEHGNLIGKSDGKDKQNSHAVRFNRVSCYKCGAIRIDDQIGLEETPDAYVAKLAAVFREVKRVLRDDGTLWLNLGDSYGGNREHATESATATCGNTKLDVCAKFNKVGNGIKPKDLIGIPWMVAFALRADGWYLRSDIIWAKRNCMPESVKDRPTKSHEYIFLLAKSQKYYYDADAIKDPVSINGKRNKRDVWFISTKPYKEAHFATFPPDLIEPCVLAGCPQGGTVLDPFNGSGTTGQVALTNNRNYIGIELNPEYIELTHKRLNGLEVKII